MISTHMSWALWMHKDWQGFQLVDAKVTESSRLFETLGDDLEALARVLQTRPGRQESRFNIERLEALDFTKMIQIWWY